MPKSAGYINLKSNGARIIFQGFFLTLAVSVADTSTVLPVIVDYFGGGKILVGITASLMKGGAIIMQLITAFKAQEKSLVLPFLRKVFVFRFLSWIFIGFSILFFSGLSSNLVLILISVFLFLFSFSAGVGVIYYQELAGKSFTKEYRGKMISYRQIVSGIAGIISGGISAYVLYYFDKPYGFSYLFLISGILMAAGFVIFWNFKEYPKEEIVKKEKNFALFLKNSVKLFNSDVSLRLQVFSRFLSYSLFMILPFMILKIKDDFGIHGKEIGLIISLQMTGAVFGNFLWGKLSGINRNKCVVILSFLLSLIAVITSFFADNLIYFYVIYFVAGASIDGFRLAFSNLVLIISSSEKRPVYVAVQNNLSSLGLFLPIFGGFIFKTFGYDILVVITVIFMFAGLLTSLKFKKE